MTAERPAAVVVGLCAHGLAISRALAREGVEVHALEANLALPGAATRCATVHAARDINAPALIDELLELRSRLGDGPDPVLLVTNDRMVRVLGTHGDRLRGRYRLSWDRSAETVLRLADKGSLEARCRETGLHYPATVAVGSREASSEVGKTLDYPVIVKPTRPLAGFKTAIVRSTRDLEDLIDAHPADLPVIAQQWIEGTDEAIHFSALYLEDGRVVARFDGHKLRSRPMGHTTIAESYPSDEVFDLTRRFFDGLAMSGPVSLEVKRDPKGRWWVIEPTVGRTDFWLDVCVRNGVNLPYVEYCHQSGLPIPATEQATSTVWFHTERDPQGVVWYVTSGRARTRGWRALRFSYFDRSDFGPHLRSLRVTLSRNGRRVTGRVRRAMQVQA